MTVKYIPFVKNYIYWYKPLVIYLAMIFAVSGIELLDLLMDQQVFHLSVSTTILGHVYLTLFYWSFLLACVTVAFLDKWFYYRGYVKIQRWPQYRAFIWRPKDLREQAEYFRGFPKGQETIVASAIRSINGNVYAVMRPGRHSHCIALMHEQHASELFISGNTLDQGFMTNTNRYISREEARHLAIRNNLAMYIHHPEELFSENLWNTPEHMTMPVETEEFEE